MKKIKSNYFVLLVLILMFTAPGVAAYLLYLHPAWLGASKINKGALLNPPVMLQSFEKNSKWKILLVRPHGCKEACLKQLDQLARVRLALGRKLYQVDEWLLIDNPMSLSATIITTFFKENDIQMSRLLSQDRETLTDQIKNFQLFIVNPDNYVILGYKMNENPDFIYQDLKLLLSTTEQKSH